MAPDAIKVYEGAAVVDDVKGTPMPPRPSASISTRRRIIWAAWTCARIGRVVATARRVQAALGYCADVHVIASAASSMLVGDTQCCRRCCAATRTAR
ncbi:MAG: hypothetical protein ACLU0O_02230 [Collinsella sp.]